MAKYIIKRVAMGIFSIFIVATVTFFVMNLVPGGPFVAEKSISAAAQQALAEKYGLDKPLGVQYVNYMKGLLHGDLGLSLRQRGRTVNQIIASKLPVSCRLAGIAVVVALCVGIPLGCISAYNRGKWLDNVIIVFATCGIAIPSFISSVLLLYQFGMNMKVLPTVGLNSAAAYIMPVGGPFVAEKSISAAAQQALAEKYGLDKPLGVQYVNYMKGLLHGDLGLSLRQRGRTVNQIIASKLPVSCRLAGIAVVVALCVGIPLGCISAYNRGKWLDNVIIVFATCGIAIPSFISSVLLLYQFGMNMKVLPTVGLNSAAAYIMPVTALAIYPSAYITRLMRSSLLDVMGQDYMRTARAKGVSQFMILFKHALRNAILPVITYVGPMLAGLMTGSFVVEKIFSVPGLGRDFVSAITNRDYTMIMGTTILLSSMVIIANVIVDILYKIIDPRIKLK